MLTAFISLFLGGYLVLSFWLFYKGLRFVGTFPGLGAILTERLLFLLFAFLFFLLLLSNLIIGYTASNTVSTLVRRIAAGWYIARHVTPFHSRVRPCRSRMDPWPTKRAIE